MSFRKNSIQQITFQDSLSGLTARERKALDRSWARYFADEIFPKIDEEPFRVLYSEKDSRPNTPVNICIGALIIKELQGVSDDEMVENLMLDQRYQLALHTANCSEQPLSDKTLSRFRNRCVRYLEQTGVDLIHECMVKIAKEIARIMELPGHLRRMDSLMIDANIKRLSRMELICTCAAKLIRRQAKAGAEIPEEHQHYLDSADCNRTFCYANSGESGQTLKRILQEASQLLQTEDASLRSTQEYRLPERCLKEQTVRDEESGGLRLRTKEDGGMHSGMLQNPSDPDATYREKNGKAYRGYAASLEETAGENGSVITDFQLESNNYSDSQFLKDSLEKMDAAEEPVTLVTDGAYAGEENTQLAAEKNVQLVPTDPGGRDPEPIFGGFGFDAEKDIVVKCPAGHKPQRCGKPDKNGHMRLTFGRSQCAECPHRQACGAKVHKKVSNVSISRKKHERARYFASRNSQEFKNLARFRNGIETVPSVLRRVYSADRMPCRGKAGTALYFGCKIGALNFRKLLTFRRKTGNYAQNPVLVQG